MRTAERQMQILLNARANKTESMYKIKFAKLYLDQDRKDFISIITNEDFERAWDMYAQLDTLARDTLMNILDDNLKKEEY